MWHLLAANKLSAFNFHWTFSSTCLNGGTCQSASCQCRGGYAGDFCQVDCFHFLETFAKSFAFTFTTLFINDFRDLFETYFLLNVSGRIPLHSSWNFHLSHTIPSQDPQPTCFFSSQVGPPVHIIPNVDEVANQTSSLQSYKIMKVVRC